MQLEAKQAQYTQIEQKKEQLEIFYFPNPSYFISKKIFLSLVFYPINYRAIRYQCFSNKKAMT